MISTMKRYFIIGFFLISCSTFDNEMIRFDRSVYSTFIDVQIDSLTYKNDSIFTVKSSLNGGQGQIINYVGICWSHSLDIYSLSLPIIGQNSTKVKYEFILDKNGDDIVDDRDLPFPLKRNFFSTIIINKDLFQYIWFRPFVIFNDTVTLYGEGVEFVLKNP